MEDEIDFNAPNETRVPISIRTCCFIFEPGSKGEKAIACQASAGTFSLLRDSLRKTRGSSGFGRRSRITSHFPISHF